MSDNQSRRPESLPKVFHSPNKLSISIFVLLLAWGSAICYGMVLLSDYSDTPGQVGRTEAQWPADSGLLRNSEYTTLLMFIHPQCSCSRASIDELAQLMAASQRKIKTQVLVFAPAAWDEPQIEADLWKMASAIPGVTVRQDPDGLEAQRFGALTSGQVLLYSPTGELIFRGGITGARGHSGSNAGRSAIFNLTSDHESSDSAPATCSVFGCPLFTKPQQ